MNFVLNIGIIIVSFFKIIYFMKPSLFLLLCFFTFSCIPLRIAPKIESDKIMVAKKFKKNLPNRHAFIFEDPKDANAFYNYVTTKYELKHDDADWNVPFEVNGLPFLFSFYEVEIPNKTYNLVPFIADAATDSKIVDTLLEDHDPVRRVGNWYIAVTVNDETMNDGLQPEYSHREAVIKYLRAMQFEYLNTTNYLEALLRK